MQPGSPAERAGVLAGDVLLRVGGTDVTTADVTTVAELLRGGEGSTVCRSPSAAGSATRTVRLTRATFTTDDVVVERLPGGISRIAVTAFTRGVGRDVAAAMAAESARPAAASCSTCATTRAACSTRPSRSRRSSSTADRSSPTSAAAPSRRTLDAFEGGDTTTPLVVLVNPSTASAAEVVAGALQDRNRAVVVGTRTYGKGSVQEPSTLSDGSALELTVGRYLTPSGRSLDGVGIEPDVVVPPGAAPEVAERRAIDVLTGLVAALGGTGTRADDAQGAGPQAGRAEPQGPPRLPHRRRLRGRAGADRHRGQVAARRARATWSTATPHIRDGEAWLAGVHIPEYTEGTWTNHEPRRERKLLLHRGEILRLIGKTKEGGITLVPLALYFKDGKAKVEIALGPRQEVLRQAAGVGREAVQAGDAARAVARRSSGKDR